MQFAQIPTAALIPDKLANLCVINYYLNKATKFRNKLTLVPEGMSNYVIAEMIGYRNICYQEGISVINSQVIS